MEETFVIHGDLLWSDEDRELLMLEDGYLLVEEGRCAGVFPTLPESLSELPLEDYSHCLVLPGMTDLHTHASQYGIRGLGLDEELPRRRPVSQTFPMQSVCTRPLRRTSCMDGRRGPSYLPPCTRKVPSFSWICWKNQVS